MKLRIDNDKGITISEREIVMLRTMVEIYGGEEGKFGKRLIKYLYKFMPSLTDENGNLWDLVLGKDGNMHENTEKKQGDETA